MPNELEKRIQAAKTKVLGEMPDVNPVSVSPSAGILDKLLGMRRNIMAITNPFTGNVSYNPSALEGQSDTDLEQLLAHELTHSRQAQNTPWYQTAMNAFMPQGSYNQRPYEMEAFQNEKNRAIAQHLSMSDPITGATDIPLPSMKTRKKMGVQ